MLTIRSVPAAEWPALSRSFADLTFEQSGTYAEAAARRIKAKTQYLAVLADGVVIAAASVRVRNVPGLTRGIAWIPAGPLIVRHDKCVADDALIGNVLRALKDELVHRQGHVLRLRFPGVAFHDCARLGEIASAAGFAATRRVAIYKSIAIDLSRPSDDLMRALSGKWRTDLRFAHKSGLVLERGTGRDFASRFLAMFDAVKEAKGFQPDIPPQFHFGLEGSDYRHEVLLATHEGKDVAGIVVGFAGSTATYLFGATSDAGRHVRAGYFLTWEGINLARENGFRWYDLGGVDFEANPDVARFKERMNGLSIEAAGPYEARPPGFFGTLVEGLETLRKRFRRN